MRAHSAAEILAIEDVRLRRTDTGEYRWLGVLPWFLHSEEEKDDPLDPGKTGQIAAQNMTKDTFRDLS